MTLDTKEQRMRDTLGLNIPYTPEELEQLNNPVDNLIASLLDHQAAIDDVVQSLEALQKFLEGGNDA